MNINISENNGQTTLALEGMLDSTSTPDFQQTVAQMLDRDPFNLVVDLAGLSYTSSQGIRALLTLIKEAMAKKGKLVFRSIQPGVREVLDMAGLSQAMTIED